MAMVEKGGDPSRRHRSALLFSLCKPSNKMRIFYSDRNCLRVACLMSLMLFLSELLRVPNACLIFHTFVVKIGQELSLIKYGNLNPLALTPVGATGIPKPSVCGDI